MYLQPHLKPNSAATVAPMIRSLSPMLPYYSLNRTPLAPPVPLTPDSNGGVLRPWEPTNVRINIQYDV